jgi:preprotein translocase subunit SecE
VSDEGDVADAVASDDLDVQDTGDSRDSGGRTAVVTKPVTRPQRPTGKRSRQRLADADEDAEGKESSDEVSEKATVSKDKAQESKKRQKSEKTASKAKKPGDRPANPFVFVYTYLKQVVAEMRKVIWPNRKQMLTYTSVVLAFLAFMVALVGLTDLGLTKLVMLVFG